MFNINITAHVKIVQTRSILPDSGEAPLSYQHTFAYSLLIESPKDHEMRVSSPRVAGYRNHNRTISCLCADIALIKDFYTVANGT
jgi:hypothetical protein